MKANILIVDDVPDNLRLLMKILDQRGYEVRMAHHGVLALQSVQALVPDMDGYDAYGRARRNWKMPIPHYRPASANIGCWWSMWPMASALFNCLRSSMKDRYRFHNIIGRSPAMLQVYDNAM
jgi:hypothetical protein